ncbi:MAG: aminopeptidase P family protein [Paludibacteraceae bacterium]
MNVKERLTALRQLMEQHHVAALIVPSTDPHGSEYVAEHWQERQFVSGFTGSAGTAVITQTGGCLWTDSRYFLQAAEQLKPSGLILQKDGEIGTPTISEWLGQTLKHGDIVAVNAAMFATNDLNSLRQELADNGLNLDTRHDLIAQVWHNRPALPKTRTYELPEQFSGRTTANKLQFVRKKMANAHVTVTLFTALDDIAWLLNVRGADIAYNPVTIAFAAVENERVIVFIDPDKTDLALNNYFAQNNIQTAPYESVYNYLNTLPTSATIGLDHSKVNYALYQAVTNATIVNLPSPVFAEKCVKNATELAGFRRAMEKDGVALTRFMMWLEQAVPAGTETELSVIDKLHEFRTEQDLFVTESFGTIAGYADHGAIVHYSSTPESDVPLKSENFLLLDSGAQFYDATTDITRTIPLGATTARQKRDYTLVLKGHIALATARFPYGTRGNQLDILARQFLWQHGLSYGHGTGHGVGHFLGDHEGPQSIRTDNNPTRLEPGMVVSDEPGVYIAGEYGIRHENLVAVCDIETNEFGRFLGFEVLTLFPFDTTALDRTLLTADEVAWLNNYHKMVYERLAPHLTDVERAWLHDKTLPL